MKDENDILYHASGLDLMLMLARLHKMGYGKLRWLSYISPNGCALRCHITTASRSFLPQISKADIINDITVSTNNPIFLDLEY